MAMSFGFDNISIYIRVSEMAPPFISDQTFSFLLFINPVIVMCAVSAIGIGTNVANIATFVKMGFAETINISLMTLTLTDLASLTCLLWMAVCYNPSLCNLVCDVIDLKSISYITGGVPRAYFTTVSGYVTCLIACERCLCVLRPLQVKTMLTRRKLLTLFTCVIVASLCPYIPIYYTTGVARIFDPIANASIVTQTRKTHLFQIDFICFIVVVAVNVTTYVLVTGFTSIIVWKLAMQSRWRARKAAATSTAGGTSDCNDSYHARTAEVSSKGLEAGTDTEPEAKNNKKKNVMSDRDKRATMTVTLIASMYITCYFPATILVLTMSLVPEFNQGRLYGNLYEVLWYMSYVIEGFCSSANILVYLKTSTKFKEGFLRLFCRMPGGNNKQPVSYQQRNVK